MTGPLVVGVRGLRLEALGGWILLTLLLSKWLDTGLTPLVLTLVLSRLLILVLVFDCRWEAWRTFS